MSKRITNKGGAQDGSPVRSMKCYASLPPVLDACCGSRMMWFDKRDNRAHYVDKRKETIILPAREGYPNGESVVIDPDTQADFTKLPFPSESFQHVVFDPPHFVRNTISGWNRVKYGNLSGDWREMLRLGFAECFRVLRPGGTLIFKWADSSVTVGEILKLTPERPLYGHRSGKRAKTHWVAFLKHNDKVSDGCRQRAHDGKTNV